MHINLKEDNNFITKALQQQQQQQCCMHYRHLRPACVRRASMSALA